MKITTSKPKLGKDVLDIIFTKATTSRFIERNGVTAFEYGTSEKKVTLRSLRAHVRAITVEVKKHGWRKVSFPNTETCALGVKIENEPLGELYAYNTTLAHYAFNRYKAKPKDGWKNIEEVTFAELGNKSFEKGLVKGKLLGEITNEVRTIANTPGGDMTPETLANEAKRALKGSKTRVTVLDKKAIAKLKMGALLGVSKGSKEDPRFIVIEYKGRKKNEPPIVFVGKGITFDTGGLNLKPSDGMLDMHLDMTGGAVVIGAMKAIAKLGIKRNVIGLIPSAENMVSGESYRPGDVLTTMSGKTVDVLNTDAEGRLVLADALTYAERYNPVLVVDVATLTGAALVALGQHASAFMTKDDAIAKKLETYAEETGDYIWRLPLWDEYMKYTKGVHGDIANIQSSGNGRFGGAINGGAFLSHFTTKFPWVHIDNAPRMTSAPGDYLAKGAAGEPMSLLVKIAEKF